MRISAYFLLGDPRWIDLSVAAIYSRVDKIIAVGDVNRLAWDGSPLPVDECVEILRHNDPERKVELRLADLVRPGRHPMLSDTEARRLALDGLQDADWVLQLDADEILTSPSTFFAALDMADSHGADALDYPSRWILGRAHVPFRHDIYLEASDGAGRIAAHYPGPLAVRPQVHLNYSRRATCDYFRVDIRRHNSYHEYTRSHPVHWVVRPNEAVMHLSWVDRTGRTGKSTTQHGHRKDHLIDQAMTLAGSRLRHPLRTVLTTPFRVSHGHPHRLRLTRIDLDARPPQFGSALRLAPRRYA